MSYSTGDDFTTRWGTLGSIPNMAPPGLSDPQYIPKVIRISLALLHSPRFFAGLECVLEL